MTELSNVTSPLLKFELTTTHNHRHSRSLGVIQWLWCLSYKLLKVSFILTKSSSKASNKKKKNSILLLEIQCLFTKHSNFSQGLSLHTNTLRKGMNSLSLIKTDFTETIKSNLHFVK